MWVEDFRPIRLSEIVGQVRAINELKECVIKRKPAILYGPTGTGKTSSVYALANELNYDVLELNASDLRNKKNIEGIMKNALYQGSLFGKNKIILIDEIDSLSSKDRGGISAIISAIKECNFPVIFTANDPYEEKIRGLRVKSRLIEYKPIPYSVILKKLNKILEKKEKKHNQDLLMKIAVKSGGDLRGAINDLEVVSISNLENLDGIGEREKKETIFNILKLIFKGNSIENVLGILMNSDVDLNEFLLWLDENLPKEYRGKDLIEAYEKLSKADVFMGRIRKWQYWRYLVYTDALVTAGITASKDKKDLGFVSYRRSGRLLKRWIMNRKNAIKYEIAEKLGKKMHVSSSKVVKEILPYLNVIARNKKDLDIGLNEEEMGYLRQ